MQKPTSRRRERHQQIARRRIPPRLLEAMIDEAIVDAYTESEQAGGFHVMIEQELGVPFETTVLGAPVIVRRVELTDANDIVALCCRGRERQAIPILELPLPDPPPRVGVDRGAPSLGARTIAVIPR